MALSSPTDQHSLISSGGEAEEEGDEQGRPREFVTGSSDDDDEGSISERRKHKNQRQSGDIAGMVTLLWVGAFVWLGTEGVIARCIGGELVPR